MAITVGLLLSAWSAFVMNRCKFASAVFVWSFCLLKNWKKMVLVCIIEHIEEFLSFCSLKLRYLGWDFSLPPSRFTAIWGSATWDFPSYMYGKLYPLFCRLEPADSPWVVAWASPPTHQAHKHTGVSPGELWLAYLLNNWCMVGIFGAVPRLKNTQKATKKFRLDTWYRFSMIRQRQ